MQAGLYLVVVTADRKVVPRWDFVELEARAVVVDHGRRTISHCSRLRCIGSLRGPDNARMPLGELRNGDRGLPSLSSKGLPR